MLQGMQNGSGGYFSKSLMNAITDSENDTDQRTGAIEKLYLPHDTPWASLIFFGVILFLLVYGWQKDLDDYINAESGLGYALGICGGVLMLLVLLYPLRKRARWMRNMGHVPNWFRCHMAMGLIAPLMILYHCGFKPGAMNSNITLASMFLVVFSGIVGRYIYGKIHYGLFGNHATLKKLQSDSAAIRSQLDVVFMTTPHLKKQLVDFSDRALVSSGSLAQDFLRLLPMSIRMWQVYFSLNRGLKVAYKDLEIQDGWDRRLTAARLKVARGHLLAHLYCLRKIAGFRFFERVFRLWHSIHIPFLYILVATALYHVYAVHKY